METKKVKKISGWARIDPDRKHFLKYDAKFLNLYLIHASERKARKAAYVGGGKVVRVEITYKI